MNYDFSAIESAFGDLSRYRHGSACWISHVDRGLPFLEGLREGNVRVIGRSVAGREILAVAYGEKEALDHTCDNLQSCLDAGLRNDNRGIWDDQRAYPPSFFGSKRRLRPVVVLQGAIHGGELSGTAAGFNLCQVIETGVDLKGKPWPKLQELAKETRILFIPWANPDGSARHPIHAGRDIPAALDDRLGRGIYRNGVGHEYPACKSVFPIPPETAIHMGSYYNDNGVNLQYDVFREALQPETLAWMRYYRTERPDAVINFHCDNGSMIHEPSAVPEACRELALRVAAAVQQRLKLEGCRTWPVRGQGRPDPIPAISQNSAIWHVSGALPLLCEMPDGIGVPMSMEEIVDIGLLAVEEVLSFAHTQTLRPHGARRR
jgi:Zinc carboxypeptidase